MSSVDQQLRLLFAGACEIKSFADEYIYSPSVPFNGFLSFVKIVTIYFDKLSFYSRSIQDGFVMKGENYFIKCIKQMIAILPLLLIQLKALQLTHQQRTADSVTKFKLELEIVSLMSEITENELAPLFSDVCLAFWLPNSLVNFAKVAMKDTIKAFYPWYKRINCPCSPVSMAKLAANRAINGSISDILKEINLANKLSKVKPSTTDMKIREFNLTNRQKRWNVNQITKLLTQEQLPRVDQVTYDLNDNCKPVKLVIFTPEQRKSNKIILHVHGGSWVMGSPYSYSKIINQWIKEIGAVVVSIDYSLAPNDIYPVALQEIVDTYLWLNNLTTSNGNLNDLNQYNGSSELNDNLTCNLFEFNPSEIVITGDSAGGNLVVSLLIILSEIIKLSQGNDLTCETNEYNLIVKLPKSISLLYPCASPGLPYDNGSILLIDPIYPITLPIKYSTCYAFKDVDEINVSYLNGKGNPWFRKKEQIKSIYTRLNYNRWIDPVFHILTYKSFELMKSVSLYIQVGEFDQVLDNCICIAKCWKGPVVLDVIPNVIHSFAKFTDHSPECREANNLATKRLKEAVDG